MDAAVTTIAVVRRVRRRREASAATVSTGVCGSCGSRGRRGMTPGRAPGRPRSPGVVSGLWATLPWRVVAPTSLSSVLLVRAPHRRAPDDDATRGGRPTARGSRRRRSPSCLGRGTRAVSSSAGIGHPSLRISRTSASPSRNLSPASTSTPGGASTSVPMSVANSTPFVESRSVMYQASSRSSRRAWIFETVPSWIPTSCAPGKRRRQPGAGRRSRSRSGVGWAPRRAAPATS